MTSRPRPARPVLATRAAIGIAGALVMIGSVVLVSVRDDLPTRIVVLWSDGEPSVRWSLGQVLLGAGFLTLGACLAVLAIGVAVKRSPGHDNAAYAAGAAGCAAAAAYGATWAQSLADGPDRLIWPIVAVVVGSAMYLGVWLVAGPRPARLGRDDPRIPAPESRLDVPVGARLAWVGLLTIPWWDRLISIVLVLFPTGALIWWLGYPLSPAWPVAVGATVGTLIRTRPRQVVVDYSGVGMRGRSAPSPIPMSRVRSAEAISLAEARDLASSLTGRFQGGGWWRRSGEVLLVHRWGAPDCAFAVDDGAAEAAAVLNTLTRSEVA
jgi:hypothetical protein